MVSKNFYFKNIYRKITPTTTSEETKNKFFWNVFYGHISDQRIKFNLLRYFYLKKKNVLEKKNLKTYKSLLSRIYLIMLFISFKLISLN